MSKPIVVVIGAGIVGCATAYELSENHFDVIVLEKNARIADETTSRNSGVIHSGIYYPPDSLKAQSCIRGQALLYEWCEKKGVPHARTGKWIVAQAEEEAALSETFQNANASGATGLSLKRLSINEIVGVKATFGLFSPNTGIVDPYAYSKSFMVAAEEKGASFLTPCEVTHIEKTARGFQLQTSRGEVECDAVVNSAGLYADKIAQMVGIQNYTIYPWRGNYFSLKTDVPYRQLIYPAKAKNAPGLGVHLTIGLDGACKLGPDVEYVQSRHDFTEPLDLEMRKQRFFQSAARYLEGLSLHQLTYDTCGIRPKLRSPTDVAERDFVIARDLPGFINLLGIESPGLTAARDLAQRVVQLLR